METLNVKNRPTTARVKTSKNLTKPNNRIISNNKFNEPNTNINQNLKIKELLDFKIDENHEFIKDHKAELEKLLKDENDYLEFIDSQKKKLTDIKLLEKEANELYYWKTLFSKSRPITAYTGHKCSFNFYDNDENKTDNNKKWLNSNVNFFYDNDTKSSNANTDEMLFTVTKQNSESTKEKPFKFPVALIDEKEELINKYITINKQITLRRKKSEEKKNEHYSLSNKSTCRSTYRFNATRPQSVYAKREEDDIFYLDKGFSDYITQDESEFVKKFRLLHPKIKYEKKFFSKTMKNLKKSNQIFDRSLKKIKSKGSDFKLDDKDLNLAGNSKNAVPLLNSIYKQMYPEKIQKQFKSKKVYLKSNRNNNSKLVIGFNIKDKVSHDYDELDKGLVLDVYNANDPEIQILNKVENIKEDEIYMLPDEMGNIKEEDDISNDVNCRKISNKSSFTRPHTAIVLGNKNRNITPNSATIRIRNKSSYRRENYSDKSTQKIEIQTISEDIIHNNTYKNLCFKEKQLPYHYQTMKKKLNLCSIKNKNEMFEDLLQIRNIKSLNEDLYKTSIIDYNLSNKINNNCLRHARPNTSKNFMHPFTKFIDRKKNEFLTKTDADKNLGLFHNSKVNNIYFNKYIDIEFGDSRVIDLKKKSTCDKFDLENIKNMKFHTENNMNEKKRAIKSANVISSKIKDLII